MNIHTNIDHHDIPYLSHQIIQLIFMLYMAKDHNYVIFTNNINISENASLKTEKTIVRMPQPLIY